MLLSLSNRIMLFAKFYICSIFINFSLAVSMLRKVKQERATDESPSAKDARLVHIYALCKNVF